MKELLGIMCTAGIDANVFLDFIFLNFLDTRAVTVKFTEFRVMLRFYFPYRHKDPT